MDYKAMFIAYDLRNEARSLRWRSAFEKDRSLAASDKREADKLMRERRTLLTSAGLGYLI